MQQLKIVLVCLILVPHVLSSSIPSPNGVISDILSTFSSKNGMNMSRFQDVFEVPACMQKCLPSVDTFSAFFRSSNMEPSTIQKICGEVNSVSQCAGLTGCSGKLLDIAASAFKFLCVDNVGFLPEALTCLQSTAPDLQEECAAICGFGSQGIKNSSLELNMKAFCGSSVCLLKCAKTKLSSKCNLGDQSILDAIVDNMQSGQNNGLDDILDVVLPSQCGEIVKHEMSVGKVVSNRPASVGMVQHEMSVEKVVSNRPASVGMTTSRIVAPATSSPSVFVQPVETVMKMDGQLRTLQCQVLDKDRNLLESPSFESIAEMISKHFTPPPPQSVSPNDVTATAFVFDPSLKDENLPGIDIAHGNDWRALHEARVPLDTQRATSTSTLSALLLFFFFL